MCCSLVKFLRVTLRPVSEILLVYCAREVEMCLIRKKKTHLWRERPFSFYAIAILQGCIRRSRCRILLTLLSDNRSAAACFRAERREDFWIEALTTATFSGPVAVRGRPGDFWFNAEPLCLKFLIRNSLPSTKPKADAKCTLCCYRRTAIFINSSTIKARCSPNHVMVYTENGRYSTVRRRAPHPKLYPSQFGVFFPPHPVLYITMCFKRS